MKPLLTVAEVADISRTTPPTVAKAIRQGELRARKIARRWLVEERDVASWLDAQPTNDLARELVERAS